MNSLQGKMLLLMAYAVAITGQLSAQVDTTQTEPTLSEQINALKPGNNKFRFTGFADFAYHQDLEDTEVSRFAHAGFAPIMIWRPSEKLFFESELHIELEGGIHGGETGDGHGGHGHGGGDASGISHGGATHMDLGYASIGYFITDWLTLVGGKFLSPFGTFNERFHPSWINRLPSAPLGFGHGGATPTDELGVQFRGGIQTGKSKVYYAVYISNGPVLEDGRGDADRAGALLYSNFADNNSNKAIGGRLAWLPLSNSSFEIGISGQFAGSTGDRGTHYEEVGATLVAADLNYVKDYTSLGGTIRLTGQYSSIRVDNAFYENDSSSIAAGADSLYTFDNSSSFYYLQLAWRLDKLESKVLRKMELVGRYDAASIAPGSKWAFEDSRITVGLNYWIQARSAFKLELRIGELNTIAMLQWAMGF